MKINSLFSSYDFDRNDLYIYDPYRPDEPGNDMSYGHLQRASDWHLSDDNTEFDLYYVPSIMSGSDYSGGGVTVANYRYIVENYGELDTVREVYGGYDTYAIAFNLSSPDWDEDTAQELIDIWEGLDGYPVIDDDTLSEVEQEAEEEAWVNVYGRWDFPKALAKALPSVESVEGDNSFDGPLFSLFWELQEKTNSEWIHETGNSAYIDVERLCDARYILESEHWKALVESGAVEFEEENQHGK